MSECAWRVEVTRGQRQAQATTARGTAPTPAGAWQEALSRAERAATTPPIPDEVRVIVQDQQAVVRPGRDATGAPALEEVRAAIAGMAEAIAD